MCKVADESGGFLAVCAGISYSDYIGIRPHRQSFFKEMKREQTNIEWVALAFETWVSPCKWSESENPGLKRNNWEPEAKSCRRASPGFPVETRGFDDLHAALFAESRTRGRR